MPRAFQERIDCFVPSLPAISGELVSACEISAVPPLSDLDCPSKIDIPPIVIPPPSFNFGCYKPTMTVHMGYNTCSLVGSERIRTSITHDVPKSLHAGVVGISTCPTSGASATVDFPNMAETGFCEPHFNIDLNLPCVSVKLSGDGGYWLPPDWVGGVLVRGGKTIVVTASSVTENCDYRFEIAFGLNCPQISGDTGTVYAGTELKIKTFVLPDYTSSLCSYDIWTDLTLGINACFNVICSVSLDGGNVLHVWQRALQFQAGVLMDVGDCTEITGTTPGPTPDCPEAPQDPDAG